MPHLCRFTHAGWRLAASAFAALALAAAAQADATAPAQAAPVGSDHSSVQTDPGAPQTQAPDLGISANEPVYFSLGFNDTLNARFQISLKFRPFGPTNDSIGGKYPWNDLYLAYTQTSVWDLESESKPFYDTSYRPGVFWQRRDLGVVFGGRTSLRGGVEHESNGKAGGESRSINVLFVRPSWWWTLGDRWSVAFSPKAYTYIEKSENTDIAEFRGYVDWQFAVEHERGLRLATTVRVGTSRHSSVLVDASYPFADIPPLRAIGLQHGYLHLQYFEGYGETILSYNDRMPWQVRVGLMLVR